MPVSKYSVFALFAVAALLLLHAGLLVVGGVLWARGDPGLLYAEVLALTLTAPLIRSAGCLLPVATKMDAIRTV